MSREYLWVRTRNRTRRSCLENPGGASNRDSLGKMPYVEYGTEDIARTRWCEVGSLPIEELDVAAFGRVDCQCGAEGGAVREGEDPDS